MHTYTELRERRHALLFTVEQGCRRQGIRHWHDIRRFLQAATYTPQGRDLLLDTAEVDEYIAYRQQGIAHKHQSPAGRTADRILDACDRGLAEAFIGMVQALPLMDRAGHATR